MATIIRTVTQLQNMSADLTADYELGNDINASITSTWNGGLGFDPIGTSPNSFTGNFEGKGYKIKGLTVNRPLEDQVGLFGYVFATFGAGGSIKNVILENCNITGKRFTGALIGLDTGYGDIVENCRSSGSITGTTGIGGLAGYMRCTNDKCSSSCSVSSVGANRQIGGLFGFLQAITTKGTASGNVNAPNSDQVGGFVGNISDDSVSRSYATGNVIGFDYVGGFAGLSSGLSAPYLPDCYARGDVTGNDRVGGFIGSNNDPLDNCYSTGTVIGNTNVGGFCGDNGDVITDSFWDTETSGQAASDGGTGKTTAQMKSVQTIQAAGWAVSTIWSITPGCNNDYPCLLDVNSCCAVIGGGVDQTIIGDKVSLEAIRNLEIVYGGRFFIGKTGNAVYESRYHRNV